MAVGSLNVLPCIQLAPAKPAGMDWRGKGE
jgi:hypothetical protein